MSLLALALPGIVMAQSSKPERIVVSYLTGFATTETPDPTLMTHINYAFAAVAETGDAIAVQNTEMLQKVVKMKEENPNLKVILSVEGFAPGRFSQVASSSKNRKAFAKSCKEFVDKYGLDGIDLMWEYPMGPRPNVDNSVEAVRNYTSMLRDLRSSLGKDKIISIATVPAADYIDYAASVRYVDYVSILAFGSAAPPKHHTTLHRSALTGDKSIEETVDAYLAAGVPAGKLVLGMPLYGNGDRQNQILMEYMNTKWSDGQYVESWDNVGQVPYLTGRDGQLVWAFENTKSIAAKCQFIIDRQLLGAMYWEAGEDNAQKDLMQTVSLSILKNGKGTEPQRKILILGDPNGEAGEVAKHLEEPGKRGNFVAIVNGPMPMEQYHLVIDFSSPHASMWPDEHKKFLEDYVNNADGSYFGIGNDSISFASETWPWTVEMVKNLQVAPLDAAIANDGGNRKAVLWTNPDKKGRTLFTAPYVDMLELMRTSGHDIIRWLLHDDVE